MLHACNARRQRHCAAGRLRETYPHNRISRTNTYRSHFEACQRVGTETDSQTRALVGRSTHASAANKSDRRNLHAHEPASARRRRSFLFRFHNLLREGTEVLLRNLRVNLVRSRAISCSTWPMPRPVVNGDCGDSRLKAIGQRPG
jgi:hypothetical protein